MTDHEKLLARIDAMLEVEAKTDLDPLKSTHIISPGFTHLANLTEEISDNGLRGRVIGMIPIPWADYIARAVNANRPMLLLVKALMEERARNTDVDNNVEESWQVWRNAVDAANAAIAAFLEEK